MSQDRPTPEELVEAVREFLEEEVLPELDDRRLRFRTLVAMNALGIATRELAAEVDRIAAYLDRPLSTLIGPPSR